MKLIVGLGNPGRQYARTRHNVGFWVIDQLSEQWGIPVGKEKWKGEVGEGFVHGEKVILLKPMTYMNLSGESVKPALDWLKLDLEDLCVIYDNTRFAVRANPLAVKRKFRRPQRDEIHYPPFGNGSI